MIARYGENDYGYSEAGYGYGVSAFTGFDGLDAVGDLLGWWSVSRRVLARYNGPAIRLRRSSDSTEQDFYGIGPQGEVSTAAVRAFNGWNLFQQTDAIDNAYWTKSGGSISSTNVAVNPLTGEQTIDRFTEDGTLNNHGISRSVTYLNGVYTISVVAKYESRTGIEISADIAAGSNTTATFNLQTGAVVSTSANVLSATSVNLGNGFFHFQVTATLTAGTKTFRIRFGTMSGNVYFFTGDGVSSSLIGGLQLEQASSFSTYDPRTTTAAGDSFLVTLYDQSGLARHFTQSTTTLQPIICEQGVPVTENGRLAAKFVAADARRMSIASSTAMFNALHSTGGSVLVVSRYNDTAATKTLLTNQNANSAIGFRLTDGSAEIVSAAVANGVEAVTSVAKADAGTTALNVLVWSLDPDNATAASREDAWRNGTLLTGDNVLTATPSTSNAATDLVLGARAVGTNPHDGTISEVAAFSALIGTADRTTWQSRSGIFYGVTIS